MSTILKKKYNYDIIINSEKIITIYNIHKFNKNYSEEYNDNIYNVKVSALKELTEKQLFLDVIDSLVKIYKNNFDFVVSQNFKDTIYGLENNTETEKQNLKKNLLYEIFFDVIIKFDEIIITNYKQHNADLKDFFIKFTMVFSCVDKNQLSCRLFNSHLYGRRSTMYDFELITGYVHSHLSRDYIFGDFNRFCLGSGPISLVLIDLSNKATPFNVIKFKGFLYQIKSYLAWESIEGGPYIKMIERNNIHNDFIGKNAKCFCKLNTYYSHSDIENTQIKQLCSKFVKLLISNELINITLKKNLKKDINEIDVEMSLEKELEFVNFLKNNEIIHLPINVVVNTKELDLFAIKRNNEYYKPDLQNKLTYNRTLDNKELFEFKGEMIKSKIISSESIKVESIVVLNPYFKKKLLSTIKNIILKNERNNIEQNKNYRIREYENTSIYI